MANSSRSLIDEINTEDERCFVDNYSFMEEQKIKKALAPAQWEEMKNALAEECTKVSKSLSRAE
jgi:phage regulator Rha-like protein